jgi:hypothetical protein
MQVATALAKPQEDAEWMELCRDPSWNYQAPNPQQELYFTKDWECPGGNERFRGNERDRANRIVTAPVASSPLMHPGSLAPEFVFQQTVENEPHNGCMTIYRKRLISFLCGRFVVIPRPSESTSLVESQGLPVEGERHWWRYWNNNGNVYQINFEKYRDEPQTLRAFSRGDHGKTIDGRPLFEFRKLYEDGLAPGDFTSKGMQIPWMRIPASITSTGMEYSNLSQFVEYMWSFTHCGTTRFALWDACLLDLCRLAGREPERRCQRGCQEEQDNILRCSRCQLVFYCNNGQECQKLDWRRHKKICKYFK